MSCYIEAELRFALGSKQTELSICVRTERHLLLVAGYREQIRDFLTSRTVCPSWATLTMVWCLCHLLRCNSLLNELDVLGLIFVGFLCNTRGCSCSPFSWCFGSCPSEVSRSRKGWVVGCISCSPDTKPQLWGSRGAGQECGHCCVCAEPRCVWGAGGAERIPWGHTAATSQFVTRQHRNSRWQLEGKRVKELPFHLAQMRKEYLEKKGMSGVLLGAGQLFVFCPLTEYNLFKYWHVLLLKDFLSRTFLVVKLC